MIERIVRDFSWFVDVEVTETETGIEVSAGEMCHNEDVYPLEDISFDLTPDDVYQVEYELYLALNTETNKAFYQLCKAYMDDNSTCSFESPDKVRLIHTLMSIKVGTDGERSGSILVFEKEEREQKNEA
ncbi:hypothetical protein [Bacillus atrophaeus]|uniref:hypothetical protein n=1 Tax=Bacillus atrophaeus TaxID=1452 RepID=UPI002DBD05AB|nr:hypothetical protein [Bacillus atrophaeus]MEC0765099.1 hypothetical protein [Bacillus atrophaeus]MEC0778230.1 hypothetical protein [Bacillus atrophaeus]MEC0808266.1 hypothetical protein [Bacillus atrophaeus]